MRKFDVPHMATEEQFQQLVIMMQGDGQGDHGPGTDHVGERAGGRCRTSPEHQGGKRTICPSAVNPLQKFGKGEDSWKEYNFEQGVILGPGSPDMLETLKFMETSADEMHFATIRAMDESRADRLNI